MKTTRRIRLILALTLNLLLAGNALAQPAPPAPPPGIMLDAWPFSGTNYLSARHCAPSSLTNVALIPTWAGNGLQVDSTNAAWITYPMVESDGLTNLNCSQGSIELWLSLDFNSTDGLGYWAPIIEVGNWSTNLSAATGAWGLFISPDGSSLYFSAQTNSVMTNYLNAPISWNAGDWHFIALTYSATNSALYLEGQFVTNGPGMSIVPGANALTSGFSIGSDSATGLLQSRAIYNFLTTYNYQLDPWWIGEDYTNDAQFVYPLPSSGGSHADDDGPPSPGGGGSGTNYGGYSFNIPNYSAGDFWVEPGGIDTNGNLTLLVHATTNTSTYAPVYELLWTESLTPPVEWSVWETFVGATNTNVTALTIPILPYESTAFFQAVNLGTNGDSAGVGIPDSWQREYFGYVGIDPFGDPMGDGYDNLYKYEHGMNPNTYYAPAAPSFSAILNTNGNVVVSWPAATSLPSTGAGAVTGYTLEEIDPDGYTNIISFSSDQLSYASQMSDFEGLAAFVESPAGSTPPVLALRVNYANGSSQLGQFRPTFDPTCTVNASVMRGPQGALYLAVSAVPSNVGAIRIASFGAGVLYPLNYYGSGPYVFGDQEYLGENIICNETNWITPYIDIPVGNITNGLYQIPPSQAPLFTAFSLQAMGIGTNGNIGTPVQASPPYDWGNWYVSWWYGSVNFNAPFMDGRTNIAQNINLFLRAADVGKPFNLDLLRPDPLTVDYSGYDVDTTLSQPTNYVWDGFSDFSYGGGLYAPVLVFQRNEFEPFEETSLFTNMIFNLDLFDSYGNFTNQLNIGLGMDGNIDLVDPSKLFDAFLYATNNPAYPLAPLPAPVLTQDMESWICSQQTVNFVGAFPTPYGCLTWNGGNSFTLPLGVQNIYGLPILSVKYFGTNGNWNVAGQQTSFDMQSWNFFQYAYPPILYPAGYYFARPQIDPVPGKSSFATTNTTPPWFIIPFGQESYFTAWAKQSVLNGYSGVCAYPQQYFDKAYTADANGNITTNETGLLSEYGDFFPLQPGKIFLTTKPDAATGTVGTNVINVIKLQLDVNHDGIMDTSFAGPDNTTADRPFVFWVNNDRDRSSGTGDPGEDVEPDPNHCDYTLQNIPSQRDLEDWARLWIVGLPDPTTNYQVTLSWNVISGNPAIKLAIPVETNGGTLYLNNSNIAAMQVAGTGQYAPSYKIGSVTASQPWTIWQEGYLTNGQTNCFLFEGAGIGKGELVMTISQNGTNIASTSEFIELHDVRDFYERLIITNNTSGVVSNWTCATASVQYASASPLGDDTNIIVYAHGGDNSVWEWLVRSDTMFKRLYWSGYHGKFSSVRWPSPILYSSSFGADWWNNTEVIGYKSAFSFSNYSSGLKDRFPGFRLHVWAHSAGGPIASEAMRLGAPFDTLILASIAMSASCYDVNAPTNSALVAADVAEPTPEWQIMGYHGAYTNLPGHVVNYFNTIDSLLVDDWMNKNQLHLKPNRNTFSAYFYDGTNSYYNPIPLLGTGSSYLVTDSQESRAMVSRSRTPAIGATGPASGQTTQGIISSAVDLHARFGLGTSDEEHGAFFTRAIQSIWPYYTQVLSDIQPPQ